MRIVECPACAKLSVIGGGLVVHSLKALSMLSCRVILVMQLELNLAQFVDLGFLLFQEKHLCYQRCKLLSECNYPFAQTLNSIRWKKDK